MRLDYRMHTYARLYSRMHAFACITVLYAFACIFTGCANPRNYVIVPETLTYKTPDWTGGFEYKMRFEPKTTGEEPLPEVK